MLERAIRIQSGELDDAGLTREQIAAVAAELGVEANVLDRALREELSATGRADRGLLRRGSIVGRTPVSGSEAEVADQVMAWMESEEGLMAVSRTGDGIRWVPDAHWTTSARLALGSSGTKALRGMPEVIHRQTSVSADSQVVEIEVPTGRIRLVAGSVGGGMAFAGFMGGLAAASAMAGGNDLGQFAVVAVPGLVVAGGTLLIISKAWTAAIRQGVQRALHGIADPDLNRRVARRQRRRRQRNKRSGWRRLVDEVADVLDDVIG